MLKENPKIKANLCWDYFQNKLLLWSRSVASSSRRKTQHLVRFLWLSSCCYQHSSLVHLSRVRELKRIKDSVKIEKKSLKSLTLNVGASSDCRHYRRLVNACRSREDHRTHRLHRIFQDDSWMSLFNTILPVIHADYAIHIWLLHETKVFLFNRWRWRHHRLDILHNCCLLLKRREEALLLLLLSLHVRDLMTHLKKAKLQTDSLVHLDNHER